NATISINSSIRGGEIRVAPVGKVVWNNGTMFDGRLVVSPNAFVSIGRTMTLGSGGALANPLGGVVQGAPRASLQLLQGSTFTNAGTVVLSGGFISVNTPGTFPLRGGGSIVMSNNVN